MHGNVLHSVLFSSCVVRELELRFGSAGDSLPSSFPGCCSSSLSVGGPSFSSSCSVVGSSGLCEKMHGNVLRSVFSSCVVRGLLGIPNADPNKFSNCVWKDKA